MKSCKCIDNASTSTVPVTCEHLIAQKQQQKMENVSNGMLFTERVEYFLPKKEFLSLEEVRSVHHLITDFKLARQSIISMKVRH